MFAELKQLEAILIFCCYYKIEDKVEELICWWHEDTDPTTFQLCTSGNFYHNPGPQFPYLLNGDNSGPISNSHNYQKSSYVESS